MNPPPGEQVDNDRYDETAIRAITDRRQLPEIDFSIHRMEDGSEVSTLERVCKGMSMLERAVSRHWTAHSHLASTDETQMSRRPLLAYLPTNNSFRHMTAQSLT